MNNIKKGGKKKSHIESETIEKGIQATPNPGLCLKQKNLRSNTLFLSLTYRDIINPPVQITKICQKIKQFVYLQSRVSLCGTQR